MTDIAQFDWDKMFMFPPYTSRDEMEQAVGTQWTTNKTYLGYLFARSALGKYPLDDDSVQKLVFINKDEVVLDITLTRSSVDFSSSERIIERTEAEFALERLVDQTILAKNVHH